MTQRARSITLRSSPGLNSSAGRPGSPCCSRALHGSRAHPEDVAPEDLQRLQGIHDLLSTLNDPLASQTKIEKFCSVTPVLCARLIAYARSVRPSMQVNRLGEALRFIGNRGVEFVLLQLLEDLTVLKADLEDEQRAIADKQRDSADDQRASADHQRASADEPSLEGSEIRERVREC